MNKYKITIRVLLVMSLFLSACHSKNITPPPDVNSISTTDLWRRTCQRCHNLRDASSYSGWEWEIAIRHMRTHAYLTPQEERLVLEMMTSGQ